MQARKESIVRRKRVNLNKSAIDEVVASSAKMSMAELDQEIGARSKEGKYMSILFLSEFTALSNNDRSTPPAAIIAFQSHGSVVKAICYD